MTNSNTDDMKGRAKQALGDLTDNQKLKDEGRDDRAGAKVKDIAEKVDEKIHEVIDDVQDRIHRNK